MIRTRTSAQAGFSLAETLVALFILGLVATAGASLLMGATATSRQVDARDDLARQIDIAQALIRNDIAAMSARAVQPNDGFSRPGNLFGNSAPGDDPFLRFVRADWVNPGGLEARSDLQLVRYRLQEGDLIREAVVRPDAVPSTPVSQRVLLRDITRIDMHFVRGGQASPDWIGDAGQDLSILPDLIEMEIVFEAGDSLKIAALTGARG